MQLQADCGRRTTNSAVTVSVKVKERIVLRKIHLRTTGRHLSVASHSVICLHTNRAGWFVDRSQRVTTKPNRVINNFSAHTIMSANTLTSQMLESFLPPSDPPEILPFCGPFW